MSGVVAWRVANHPPGPFALRKKKPIGWACIEPLVLQSDLAAAIARAEAAERVLQQPWTQKVTKAIDRFYETSEDDQDTDIGRPMLDVLTTLGLLEPRRAGRYGYSWSMNDDFDAAIAAQQAEGGDRG